MYDTNLYKRDVTCSSPLLCHKLSHLLGPLPSSVTYFMDGPILGEVPNFISPEGTFNSKVRIDQATQSALEFCPIHCPNGRLGQDLGFVGFAFALKLPELLNTNSAAVMAKLGQTSCFPNGPQIWCPIGQ